MARWIHEADVAVVGSGPAGAAAARRLAAGGLRVLLIDRAAPPRYKCCGGGVVPRAAARLPLPDPGRAAEVTCHEAELGEYPGGPRHRLRRSEPLVHFAMRDRLDALLAGAAERAGAVPLYPCTVRGLRQTAEAVEIDTSEGPLRVRFVIGADGAKSSVARQAGWTAPLRVVPALEWEIEGTPELRERFGQAPRFDFGVPARGYAWVFPKAERLSVGLLSTARRPRGLAAGLQAYLASLGIASHAAERHGAVIPVRPRAEGPALGRVLLAGDAAGLADPVTGEGISHALISGDLAAQAIVECGLEQAARVRRSYGRQLERAVLSELRYARALAGLVYRPALRRHVLARFGRGIAAAMADVISGRRSYRGLVLDPLSYARALRLVARAAGNGQGFAA